MLTASLDPKEWTVETLGEVSREYFKILNAISYLPSLGGEPFPQAPNHLMSIDKTDVTLEKLSKSSQYGMKENAKVEKVCDTSYCTL